MACECKIAIFIIQGEATLHAEEANSLISFEEFHDGWVKICRQSRSAEEKGIKFEGYFLENALIPIIPKGYKTAKQAKIRSVDYKFDFLIVKSGATDYNGFAPQDVLAAFEVKSHGFYSQPNIERVKLTFETVGKAYPQIKLFYVTFRETNYYDKKARSIFGNEARWYYRLSDSGDGVQLPPKSYFPDEWTKLMTNLSILKQS
jgi:hypothetical protein